MYAYPTDKILRPTLICEAPPITRTRRARTTKSWRVAMAAARACQRPRRAEVIAMVRDLRAATIDSPDKGRRVARWLAYNLESGCIDEGTPRPVPAGWRPGGSK